MDDDDEDVINRWLKPDVHVDLIFHKYKYGGSRGHDRMAFSIQSCRSCYATQHLCQRSFYKTFVKFRNSQKNVLKIVLIIVNINKDENKSLISNQLSLKNDFPLTSWRTILQR